MLFDSRKKEYENVIDSFFDESKPIDGNKYSFKNALRHNFTVVVDTMVNWLVTCLNKYSEDEFHNKMRARSLLINKETGERKLFLGFDFPTDMRRNHKLYYKIFTTFSSKNTDILPFDSELIFNKIITILEVKQGWILTEDEKTGIRQTIERFKNIIYHNNDFF